MFSRFRWRTQMEEQRKYESSLTTILAARKLNEIGSKPCPARECAISDAISNADLILKRIGEHRFHTSFSQRHRFRCCHQRRVVLG